MKTGEKKSGYFVEMTTTAPQKVVLQMAVPDAEYALLCHHLSRRPHTHKMTVMSKEKEKIEFYATKQNKIKAIRVIDGKPIKFEVEPMSAVMGGDERAFIKKKLKEQYPDYNDARLEVEADMVFEMRKSVETLVKETGCKPEHALKAIEAGIASKEAELMMKHASEVMAFSTKTTDLSENYVPSQSPE